MIVFPLLKKMLKPKPRFPRIPKPRFPRIPIPRIRIRIPAPRFPNPANVFKKVGKKVVRFTKKATKVVIGEFKKIPQVVKKLEGAIKSVGK